MRSTLTRSITALILVIAMAVGMTASLGGKANAASTIKITFNANGGYCTTNGQQKVIKEITSGSSITLLTTFARPGFSLSEWQVKGKNTKCGRNQTVSFTSDTELLAVWVPNKIKITYNLNGGTWKSGNTSQSYTYGNKYTLTPPTCTKTGYTLKGWNTKSNGSGTMYQSGQSNTMFSSDITLYAIWTPNTGTITYHENGGQIASISSNGMKQSFTVGKAITLSPPSFYRTGCTLLGLSPNSKASTATYKVGGSYKFDASTTLYAIWGATVTYNANGGRIVSGKATQDFVSGVSFTLSAPQMVNPKHDLLGFSTNPKATTPTYKVGSKVTLSSNTMLYAVWGPLRQGKKAIVILPGIGGSNFYDSKGNYLWNSSLNPKNVVKTLFGSTAYINHKSNGDTASEGNYGFDNDYEHLYMMLKAEYDKSSEYEVILYQYDWRNSVEQSATALKRDIGDKYDKIVLVGHSMGGLVASAYIAQLGASASSKIELALFLGTPFLGAPIAKYLFYGGSIDKFYPNSGLNSIEKAFIEALLPYLCNAFSSYWDLAPDLKKIREVVGAVEVTNIKNMPLTSMELKSAIYYNGEENNISNRGEKYWYKDSNNTLQHVTNRVNSFYIVGYGFDTVAGGTERLTVNELLTRSGDSIVPEYSAGLNDKYKSRVYHVKDSHMGLLDNSKVDSYIKAKINTLQ